MKMNRLFRQLAAFLVLAATAAAGAPARPVIYQLLVRTFANANETRKPGGSMAENGCGKFAGINDAALASLKAFGATHVWLTGIHEQASATAYPGRPADDPDILKGMAGSPYAIKDYFDVSPDYAVEPDNRREEFQELLRRCRSHGLKVLIDFVPNHVSRAYASDVNPGLSLGATDDTSAFHARDNNFYYLQPGHPDGGPPLRLPGGVAGCDGLFPPESGVARVTGNNAVTWAPAAGDWYETIKLNYGHDFTRGRDTSALPGPDAAPDTVPDTWRKMDAILAHWQAAGIDGFRVDMAHMVPMPFWRWALARARQRSPGVFFVAEAYDNDPAKLTDGNVLEALLDNGFDAVYDDATYDVLHGLFTGNRWANDLDALCQDTTPLFHRSLRYGENHDEVRLANPGQWGGHGAKAGLAVTSLLFALGRGPLMVYHGQEVGEQATGTEGFGGDDGRTTIFDYWSLPALQQWANGGAFDGARLTDEQKQLRESHARLLAACQHPALASGAFLPLNPLNIDNPAFGRLPGETASGHWLHAFLRIPPPPSAPVLVVANLHPTASMANIAPRLPADMAALTTREHGLTGRDLLGSGTVALGGGPGTLSLPALPPLSVRFYELEP